MKSIWFSKDQVTQGHKKHKIHFISPFSRLWSLNLIGRWLFSRGHLWHKSHCTTVALDDSHVTNKKLCISISTRLKVTKFDKVIDYDIGSPRTESDDSFITWSYVFLWHISNTKRNNTFVSVMGRKFYLYMLKALFGSYSTSLVLLNR